MNCAQYLSMFDSLVFRRRPVYAHVAITHRCNLVCRMCNVRHDVRSELSPEQIGVVAEALRGLGVSYISLSGGEPFIRPDLPAVVRLLIGKGLEIRLLTNGIESGCFGELADAGLRELSVSLHSMDPVKHDQVTGLPGSWQRTTANMAAFARRLSRRGGKLLINTVVSALNIRELPDIADFARENGYHVSYVPIEASGERAFLFSPEHHADIRNAFDRLILMKRRRNAIFNSTLFLERSRDYLVSGRRAWECDAGGLYLSVNPLGEVSVCHRFDPEGSLLDRRTVEFLKTAAFRRKAAELRSGCPGCLRPCWAEMTNLARDWKSRWEMLLTRFR